MGATGWISRRNASDETRLQPKKRYSSTRSHAITMLPSTPSKKVHIDDLWNEGDTFNTPRGRVVPEDLTIALQNLGSRVRKSVTEGYNTHLLATFPVPPTPCSSPAKQTTPAPIFRSANDAFNSVFPPGCIRLPLTPSPKKRRHQEEFEGESRIRDDDVEMEPEPEIDDDQVRVILGPDATSNLFSLPRKIKPLRRSTTQNRGGAVIPQPCSPTSQDVGVSLDMVQGEGDEMDFFEGIVN